MRYLRTRYFYILCFGLSVLSDTFADPIHTLPDVQVTAPRNLILGIADTASEGVATQEQITDRAFSRAGEVMEVVPGLIVSQHSGEGKANQYFLRGFNLDHGLDFKITLDGMPINQRSHAHGQGWSDLNFLIPELISSIVYRKGPYFAQDGDFANVGAADIRYYSDLSKGLASLGIGQDGYLRTLLMNSKEVDGKNTLYALEFARYNGPWSNPDDLKRINGLVRLSDGTSRQGYQITAMGYSGKWNATDQIPLNEYQQGRITRWDSMDPTDGGKSSRYSLSGRWARTHESGVVIAQAYVIRNVLDLYSNFEYSANRQFNQSDQRTNVGMDLSKRWDLNFAGRDSSTTVGLQAHNDLIRNGLFTTQARVRLATQREDRINESSLGIYTINHTHVSDSIRTLIGVRVDYFRFKNTGISNPVNSDTVGSQIVSPKFNITFGPWVKTEYYLSLGRGFHSNDARGVTIGSGIRSDGLVASKAIEFGIRSESISGLHSTVAVFQLNSDSEIIYEGDSGTTADTGRRSRRQGIEMSNYYHVTKGITIDLDLAYTRSRFVSGVGGTYIEGAVEGVGVFALRLDNQGPTYGVLQYRYFGPRPLTEDNVVRSNSTQTINSKWGYRISKDTQIELLGINLTNRKDSAIDYYNGSYSFDGVSGLSGRVFHPIEPRMFRASFISRF